MLRMRIVKGDSCSLSPAHLRICAIPGNYYSLRRMNDPLYAVTDALRPFYVLIL